MSKNTANILFRIGLVILVINLNSCTCLVKTNTISAQSTEDNISISKATLHTCCKIDLNETELNCDSSSGSSIENTIISSTTWTTPSHLVSTKTRTTFKLKEKEISCDNETVYLSLVENNGTNENFLDNGYLRIGSEFYHMDEYCINGKTDRALEVTVCNKTCDGERQCINKCCSLEKVVSLGYTPETSKGCSISPTNFEPTFYHDFVTKLSKEEFDHIPAPHFTHKSPRSIKILCSSGSMTILAQQNISDAMNKYEYYGSAAQHLPVLLRMQKDGKIFYREEHGKCKVLDPNKNHFCIDHAINYGEAKGYTNPEEDIIVMLCAVQEKQTQKEKSGSELYGSLMVISSIFLLLTILVYAVLWEKQTVGGWTIVSHTVSLFFMYIFLGSSHLIRVTIGENSHNTSGCIIVGVLTHFFFLSTFCWLTVISFDLWYTFRAITPRSGTRSKGLKRYVKYSGFGWGIPTTIIIVALILDNKLELDCNENTVKPGYGQQSCYLQENAMGEYLYMPIGVMLCFNLMFFAITTVKLYQFRQSTKMATKDDTLQQFYRLFVKLFFIMGVSWIFEVISWACSGMGVFGYWVIFDIMNILRAVAVFFIFVCKPDIIEALEQKCPCLRPILLPFKRIFPKKPTLSHATETESFSHNSTRTKNSSLRLSTSKTNSLRLTTSKDSSIPKNTLKDTNEKEAFLHYNPPSYETATKVPRIEEE